MPALTANCLAQCALTLGQYDYTTEYQKTVNHGNADALSFLPPGNAPPEASLQELVMQYGCTQLDSGYSHSELLNRQEI